MCCISVLLIHMECLWMQSSGKTRDSYTCYSQGWCRMNIIPYWRTPSLLFHYPGPFRMLFSAIKVMLVSYLNSLACQGIKPLQLVFMVHSQSKKLWAVITARVHHKFDLSCTCMGGGYLNTHWNVQFLCEPCGIRLIILFHEHIIPQISKGRNSVDFCTVQRVLLTFIILTSVTKECLYVKKKTFNK